MALPNPLNAGFPAAPLVNPQSGEVTPVWRSFLLALFNRTGQSAGVSSGVTAAALAAETAARVAADQSLSMAEASEATTRAAAVSDEAALRIAADGQLEAQITALSGASAVVPVPVLARIWFGR
jgi:hypothetical protein